MIELEKKYSLQNISEEEIIKRINAINATIVKELLEKDVIFKPKKDIFSENFLKLFSNNGHYFLRLRYQEENSEKNIRETAILTFRKYSYEGNTKQRETIAVNISASDFNSMRDILKMIGFDELVLFTKKRRVFRLNSSVEIRLDFIEEINKQFIEISIFVEDDKISYGEKMLSQIAEKLGLREDYVIKRPYHLLVLHERGV